MLLQAQHDYLQGNYPVVKDDAAQMCALQMQAEAGPTVFDSQEGLEPYLEKFVVKQVCYHLCGIWCLHTYIHMTSYSHVSYMRSTLQCICCYVAILAATPVVNPSSVVLPAICIKHFLHCIDATGLRSLRNGALSAVAHDAAKR